MRRRFLGKSTKDLSDLYLTFDILEDNTEISIDKSAIVSLLRYSINGGDFIIWNSSSSIIVHKNDVVYFSATELVSGKNSIIFIITKGVAVRGNLLSISNGIFTSYKYLFASCNIKSVSKDFLQFTEVTEYCYTGMFARCTSLVNAPELPATTLKKGCYNGMFNGCTSLTTAPELPATTLASSCYNGMFNGCTKLNYIKALFTTWPSTTYTDDWVYSVASSGTFVKNPEATWDVVGVNGVPRGWTVKFDGKE